MARKKHKKGKRPARKATARRKPARRKARARTGRKTRRGRVSPAKAAKPQKVIDPKVAQAMKVYEEAMKQFNRQNFRRAQEEFEKVLAGPSRELAERARVHIAICEQRMQRPAPVRLRTADDHYHFAVSQINLGNYEDARLHLEKARKLSPKSEYIHYALASVAALTGEADEALDSLTKAIELRPENRYHARNDADFKLLEDDTRFQELLYPDRPVGATPGVLRV
jgi:tetratricopeptide (TPR) repeat protein